MKSLRNSMLILLALTSIVSSVVDNFTVEELQQLQKALQESSKYMTNVVKNEDAVICIGVTRSGKSTLVNYLIGNPLFAERRSSRYPIAIRKVNNLSPGPEIESGSTSKTSIPTKWISRKLPHLAIWDSPGFEDNRGPVQDITNAFYLYQLLQKVNSLRVVLVVDINDIFNDNIKPFVSALNAVEYLLGLKNTAHSSVFSVIFTKVPDTVNDARVDMELINSILSEQFLRSNMSLSETSRGIVEFLVKNNNRIAFLKRPKVGLVSSAIDVNIFPAIKNSSPLGKGALKEMRPSVSDASKIYLYKSKNVLVPVGAFNDFEKVVSSVIVKKVQHLKNNVDNEEREYKLRRLISQLNEISSQLDISLYHESDFCRKMETIQSIDKDIEKEIEKHNLLEKIQLMKFIDKLLNLEQSDQLLVQSLQGVLLHSSSQVRQDITSAELELKEIRQKKQKEEERLKHQANIDRLNKEIKVSKRHKKSGFLSAILHFLNDIFG